VLVFCFAVVLWQFRMCCFKHSNNRQIATWWLLLQEHLLVFEVLREQVIAIPYKINRWVGLSANDVTIYYKRIGQNKQVLIMFLLLRP
jgi:hypothetical protein